MSRPWPLLAPAGLSPGGRQALPAPDGAAAVELVWTAPEQRVPVRFFVEVMALRGAGARQVFAGFVEPTATLALLDGRAARYAWRVYAVDDARGRYAASPWAIFAMRRQRAGG